MSTAPFPPQAYAATLAGLGEMTIHRLVALLRDHTPADAFAVAAGQLPPRPGGLVARVLDEPKVRAEWRAGARPERVGEVWARCNELGLMVTIASDPEHPAVLAHDPLPVPVLFSLGDRSLLQGRRVAMVGTRNATAAGRHIARLFGTGLALAGVQVVSGLARGVDGQSHLGVFEALDRRGEAGTGRPVAVVASGHDVVYPREHRALWQRVATEGLLLSESPPGMRPEAFRFPLRNRLVAALSEIVVVVESRERGGSLLTAGMAADRGVPVMAVPVHAASRASLGTNGLLRDGAAPALDVGDILIALDLDHARQLSGWVDTRRPPRHDDREVLQVCRGEALTIDGVAARLGKSLLEVAMALARLEQAGWLWQADGWYESLDPHQRHC